jgi:hypothetical protein
MPTPRNLDPKFKDEKNVSDETHDETPEVAEDNGTQIVYRQQVQKGNGIVEEVVHGPMPREEWPAYEKEHGL